MKGLHYRTPGLFIPLSRFSLLLKVMGGLILGQIAENGLSADFNTFICCTSITAVILCETHVFQFKKYVLKLS